MKNKQLLFPKRVIQPTPPSNVHILTSDGSERRNILIVVERVKLKIYWELCASIYIKYEASVRWMMIKIRMRGRVDVLGPSEINLFDQLAEGGSRNECSMWESLSSMGRNKARLWWNRYGGMYVQSLKNFLFFFVCMGDWSRVTKIKKGKKRSKAV